MKDLIFIFFSFFLDNLVMAWHLVSEIPQDEVEEFVKKFRKKSRFLVDERLGANVAKVLCDEGWNAKYVGKLGLKGHSDEDVFARAWSDDRIILTHDTDFLDDRRFPPHRNPGVVVLPGAQGDDASLLTALAGLLSFVGPFREGYRKGKVIVSANAEWTFIRQDPDTGAMKRRRFRIPPRGPMEEWRDE
ncbi:MAG: DUF5615 family PIN-like protein [Planctomycetes bacterium]|nr:DUF5615 family PIN-like protein [Planctomycetota bacterium]